MVTLPRERAAGTGLLSLQFRYTLQPTLSGFYLAAFAGAPGSSTPSVPHLPPTTHTSLAVLSWIRWSVLPSPLRGHWSKARRMRAGVPGRKAFVWTSFHSSSGATRSEQ